MNVIIYIIVSSVIYIIVEKIARRYWNIQNNSAPFKGVNPIHTWVLRIGWTVIFISFMLFDSGLVPAMFLILLWGIDAYLQWKVNKVEREYMISVLGLFCFIVFITVGYRFDLLI
jgi:hypothetical protein